MSDIKIELEIACKFTGDIIIRHIVNLILIEK